MNLEEISVTYKTLRPVLYKIRGVMYQWDNEYTLAGFVESDDTFLVVPTQCGKRGFGIDKAQIFVGSSLNNQVYPFYPEMAIVPNIKGEMLVNFVEKNLIPRTTISNDAYY